MQIQKQNNQATDTCGTDERETIIRKAEENTQHWGRGVQAGDSRPRIYDHFSNNDVLGEEGQHLKHTIKPTNREDDSKDLRQC
jgi:hypothetical protein